MKVGAPVGLAVCIVLHLHASALADASARPNIVMIVADDLREQDLQFLPSIQSIAAQSAHFPMAITTFPLCTPSRAMLLTGWSQERTGIRGNDASLFDPAWPTLGTRLRAAGYRTAIVGKVLNEMSRMAVPRLPGWDTWLGLRKGNELGREQPIILTHHAARFLRACRLAPAVPCFLYLAPVSPHGPLPGPARCDARTYPPSPFPDDTHDWARRMNSLCGLDHMVAKILRRLPPNTVFIFVSDNGFIFENGREGKSATVWDAVHVPLLIYGPGIVAGERREITTLYDLAAAILEVAGVGTPPGELDGKSLLPLAQGMSVPWQTRLVVESQSDEAQ